MRDERERLRPQKPKPGNVVQWESAGSYSNDGRPADRCPVPAGRRFWRQTCGVPLVKVKKKRTPGAQINNKYPPLGLTHRLCLCVLGTAVNVVCAEVVGTMKALFPGAKCGVVNHASFSAERHKRAYWTDLFRSCTYRVQEHSVK